MAITPAQTKSISQQIAQIQSGISALSTAKSSGMAITPTTTVQQAQAYKPSQGGAVVGGRIVGAGGVDLGAANPADLPGAGSPRISAPTALNQPIDVSQPSPQTAQIQPPNQAQALSQAVPMEQALKNLQTGGLKGQELTSATDSLKKWYQGSKQMAGQTGVLSPQDAGAGYAGSQQFLNATQEAPNEPPSLLGQLMGVDANFDSIFTGYDEFMSPVSQKKSLLEEYKQMEGSLGIQAMNEELIDAKRIIEGTEDDIRAEVTATGGFATDSQVLALSNARNKSLIKNYNYLLESRDNARTQLNTYMDLSIKDREMAEAEFDRKMNFAFKVAEFKERATTNARNTYMSLGSQMGWDTLLSSVSPYEQQIIGRSLGLDDAGLQNLALRSREDRSLEMQERNLRMANLLKRNTQVIDLGGGRKALIDSQTGETIRELGGEEVLATEFAQAQAQQSINTVDGLKSHPGLNNAVGTGGFPFKMFTRKGTALTGSKEDFIAEVEKLTSQLSLESLINAKSRGATFGALSDTEMRILSAAATKIGTFRKTNDEGKVVGYKASEKNFKKELDNINNFAKLDFILKGGDPSLVNVYVINGNYFTKNSDGTITQLR